MIANYHSHTFRCHHATGTQREFVETAIQAGYKVFGFSDHTPYPFGSGYVSPFRMLPEDLEGYVRETLDLKKEYQDDITIRLGLEAEYYPRYFEALLRLCEPYPFEYFLLGQHATDNEEDGAFSGHATDDETVLIKYCRQVCSGLDTGKFLYLAHPDLVYFTGDPSVYDRYMRDLCRKLKALGVPAEINFLGLHEGRNYPNPAFWKIAGEEKVDVILGADAHHREHVYQPGIEQKALDIVRQNGLHLLNDLEGRLRPGGNN